MSDIQNNSQNSQAQNTQDPNAQNNTDQQDPKLTAEQQGSDSGEGNDDDFKSKQSKNFESLRLKAQKLEEENARFKKEKEDEERKRLEEQGNLKELMEKDQKQASEQISALQKENRELKLNGKLAQMGIHPEFIDFVLDRALKEVEFDDQNNPSNLDEYVENLRQNKPSLFSEQKKTPMKVGTSNTKSPQASQGITYEEAVRIVQSGDAEAYGKNKEAIDAVLRERGHQV